jgi:hypothetical protein
MRVAFLFLFLASVWVGCSDDDYGQDLGNNDMTVDVGTD